MHARAKMAAVALGAMLSVSACSLTAAITTSNEYDPADGTGTTIGQISTADFLLVATEADKPAALVGAMYNSGADDARVRLVIGQESYVATVPAHGTLNFGFGEGDATFVTDAPVAPGLITQISVQPENVPAENKPLPVVDGTFEQYQPVLKELQDYKG